jgi:hypothetical protein
MKKPGLGGAGREGVDIETTSLLIAAPKKRKPPQQRERQVQRAVLERLAWCAPSRVTCFHIPNGGYRKPVEAAIMKGTSNNDDFFVGSIAGAAPGDFGS